MSHIPPHQQSGAMRGPDRAHGSPTDAVVDDVAAAIASVRPNHDVPPLRAGPVRDDPSKSIETLAIKLDVSVDEVLDSINDGSFRAKLAQFGVGNSLGLLVDTRL